MSFNRSPFKSINAYSVTVVASGPQTVAITTVNPSYAMVVWGGCSSNGISGFPTGEGSAIIYGIGASSINYTSFSVGGTIKFTVVEFFTYQLRQAVQYNLGDMNGVTFKDTAITAVGPKAFVNFLGISENNNSIQTDMASVTGDVILTSTTNVRVARQGTGGANSPDDAIIGFCVVDPW